jgi:hypothetical protein
MINHILYIATFYDEIEVVKELLNYNAYIDAKNIEGRTALIEGFFYKFLLH